MAKPKQMMYPEGLVFLYFFGDSPDPNAQEWAVIEDGRARRLRRDDPFFDDRSDAEREEWFTRLAPALAAGAALRKRD